MDNNLKELQEFANILSKKPEAKRNHKNSIVFISQRNTMFNNGTKKLNKKINKQSSIALTLKTAGAKKD